ncbi:MAG TPA: DEAD/DEAH box helicase, partial [Thermoplasmata archaeon]|nr:DEAD/DEAH box helicase [Thermoplasmata archaeon]
MLHRVKKAATKDEVLALLQPLLRGWFTAKFEGLTEPQSYAVPLIHARKNVLVSSPTGSGKTLTAFLSIINELYAKQLRGELESRIYCLYVSPLKALANDINRNLEEPLREIAELAAKEGAPAPEIRVAVRSGDTSAQERQKQVRRPPHIFITTPESLAIILSTPKFREAFSQVEWVIIDEIHALVPNKRGAHLALSLERLERLTARPPQRIGLSATQRPLEEVADLLGAPDAVVAAVLMQMMGDLTGRTLILFPAASARRLCDILFRRDDGSTDEFGELEQSGLKEVGNILV